MKAFYKSSETGRCSSKIKVEDAKRFYQPDPIIRKGLEDVMINAENLPRVIYQLKEKYPDKFELLKDVYSQLFPDIEDIVVNSLS